MEKCIRQSKALTDNAFRALREKPSAELPDEWEQIRDDILVAYKHLCAASNLYHATETLEDIEAKRPIQRFQD